MITQRAKNRINFWYFIPGFPLLKIVLRELLSSFYRCCKAAHLRPKYILFYHDIPIDLKVMSSRVGLLKNKELPQF